MAEEPPGGDGNMSDDGKGNEPDTNAVATTESKPGTTTPNIIAPRTPDKKEVNSDDVLPSSTNGRKFRALFENMRDRFNALQKKRDDEKAEHDKLVSEKDASIKELKARLGKNVDSEPNVMKMCNKDLFVAKLRKGARSDSKRCEVSGCVNDNVYLIKRNMCGNLVCEDCSGVKITKLRPVMNECATLYFTCHSCDQLIRDTSNVNVYDILKEKTEELETSEKNNAKLTQQVDTLDDRETSLKQLLEERESSLHETEAILVSLEQNSTGTLPSGSGNIEVLINKRFDNSDKNIDALIEKKLAGVLPFATNDVSNTDNRLLFSSVVGDPAAVPTDVSAIKTSRNAELVEKQERDRRVNNIIIYGISEEITEENLSIKDHDVNFIKSFVDVIEADVEPKQIVRLGNENADKKRPVKVILKNKEDKNEIMSNLNKLKNADTALRGISVRDDYTLEERKLIRTMNEEARKRNEAENVTHWKVRGTPKNGLRVVKITARS